MVYGTNMFGDPTASYFTAINGTSPIVVTTAGTTATISHANSGVTAGTYNSPSQVIVNATGHITSITAGSGGVSQWTPTVLGGYYGYTSANPAIEQNTGLGYNVDIPSGVTLATLVGFDATCVDADAGASVGVGNSVRVGNSGDIAIGSAATTDNASDTDQNRIIIGAVSYINGSQFCIGIGAQTHIDASASGVFAGYLCVYDTCPRTVGIGTSQDIDTCADGVFAGYNITAGANSDDCSVVGANTTVGNAVGACGLGEGQTINYDNTILLGQGAADSANDELVTGTQTRLRFPSLAQAAAGANSYPMLWDSSTKVCVPATFGYGTWTTFTTTWYNITQGNGTQDCRYTRFGNIVFVMWRLLFGNTTSVTGSIGASLPVTAADNYFCGGYAHAYDSSTGTNYSGSNTPSGDTANTYAVTNPSTNWNATTPMTWATSDIFAMTLWYRV